MKFEMTEKDKKLLIFLAVFVIVVCIGYWGIVPCVKSILSTNEAIVEAKTERDDIDMKLAELPIIQVDNIDLENDIAKAREPYFPIMTSSEIDRYFTEMGLKYNLNRYDLMIDMPEDMAELEAYQYSEQVESSSEEEESDEHYGGVSKAETEQIEKVEAEAGEDATEEEAVEAEPETGIYSATVSMRLGGKQGDLEKLVDDLSNSKQKIRVCSYSYDMERNVDVSEEATYEIVNSSILNITVEIYMCEE